LDTLVSALEFSDICQTMFEQNIMNNSSTVELFQSVVSNMLRKLAETSLGAILFEYWPQSNFLNLVLKHLSAVESADDVRKFLLL
jgi:hypothetical protein